MANYDVTIGNGTGHLGVMRRVPYVVENVVDLVEVNAGAGPADGDVLRLIDVPAETLVLGAGFEIIEALADGGALDLDMGDGASLTRWVDNYTTTTVGYATRVATTTTDPIKVYTTADTIDIRVVDGGLGVTTGMLRAWALMVDISGVKETSSAASSQYDTAV